MPIVSTGQITIVDVNDGVDGLDGPALQVISSAAGFTYQDGIATPLTQAIAFTTLRQGVDGSVVWSASDGMVLESNEGALDVSSFAFGLPGTGDGNTVYLDLNDFGSLRQGNVVASVDGLTAFSNIVRIGDSTAAAGATRNIFSGDWLLSYAYAVGDIVAKDGFKWVCIQDHTSSALIEPPVYPAVVNSYWRLEGARESLTTSAAIAGSTWVDASANSAISTAGGVSPVSGDVVTLYNTGSGYSETRIRSSAGTWTPLTVLFGGNVIVDNTLTAAKIQASAITTDKLAANAVTAAKIAANTITASQIAANTITASQIAADTITAAQIAAGAISASELAANAITASKIAVVDMTNIWRNPDFAGGSSDGLFLGTNGAIVLATDAGVPASAPTTYVFKRPCPSAAVTDLTHSNWITAAPGETFYFEITTAAEAGTNASIQLQMRYADATLGTNAGVSVASSLSAASYTTWTRFGATVTVPATVSGLPVAYVRFYIRSNTVASPVGAWYITRVIVRRAANAEMVVDGAITAEKISAGAVTTAKLAAGAVTANEIASNAITAVKIDAGAVTTAKLAAGAVTANEIAASTITGAKIAANTITASNIAADTITAGQIAAGAITASEVASNAITTAKLFVSGAGPAINDDPNTQDASAWTGGTIAIVSDTTSPTASALQITSTGSTTLSARSFPLDAAKNYNLRIKAKQVTGTSTSYLLVAFLDSAGAVLSGTAHPTGWPGVGSYHYFGRVNQTIPTSWTEYSISFGPDEVAKIPAGAVRAQVGFLGNYTGSGEQRFTSVRLMEKAAADLIVDGAVTASKVAAGAITTVKLDASAVTADKIAANAVTAAKIEAGAITTAKLAAGAVTANEIAAGAITTAKLAAGAVTANEIAATTITGGKIAAGTITGSNIAADTITAGQIAAGAISASEVAAGAITVQKLLVAPVSLCPDPYFSDTAWWTATLYDANGWYFESGASYTNTPVQVALWSGHPTNVPGATRKHLWSGPVPAPAVGTNLRLRARMRNESNQPVYVTARFQDLSGTVLFDIVLTSASGSGLQNLTAQGVVPSNAATIRFIIYNEANNTFSGSAAVSAVMLDVAASADLIVDGAITANKIAANAIAVGTAAIQNGAIVNAMIGAAAVDAAKIADATITAAKIGDAQITGAKIASATITAANIVDATISNAKIANGAITAAKIGDAEITTAKIASTIQSTNWSSSAGWQINKAGTATFNEVALRGAINGGAYTGYAWPTAGTPAAPNFGVHLSASGLLLGNYNTLFGTAPNNYRKYFQIEASGNVYAPGFSIVDGSATFSGTLTAGIVNTSNIVGSAVTSTYTATVASGTTASVSVVVPASATSVVLMANFGYVVYNDGKTNTNIPLSGEIYFNGASVASNSGSAIAVVSPGAGTFTASAVRSYAGSRTMSIAVLVAKR